jgi:hypothetical protein
MGGVPIVDEEDTVSIDTIQFFLSSVEDIKQRDGRKIDLESYSTFLPKYHCLVHIYIPKKKRVCKRVGNN